MNSATVKTIVGFCKTMIEKYTPINVAKDYLEGIYNYRKYSNLLSTSGQPTEEQLKLIKQAGFNDIINLAPHNVENSLTNEAKTVADLNMSYTHIPVDFKKPTDQNFEDFIEAYQACEMKKVWIHCAANMRVSAFLYKYRRDIIGMSEPEARVIMDTIWEPYGEWNDFLENET